MLDNWTMEEVPPCFEGDLKSAVPSSERDPDVLHAALLRETAERRRAECLAKMQADVRSKGAAKPKHVMHLIRLLLSGIGILRHGVVQVRVEEHRDSLLAIRRGEMPSER